MKKINLRISLSLILCFCLNSFSYSAYIQYVRWREGDEDGGQRNPLTDLPYKIGDKLIFEMYVVNSATDTTPCPGGKAVVDIGVVHRGIELKDVGGGNYKAIYYITEGVDHTTNSPIFGRFEKNHQKATNNGLKAKGNISIDAIRPIVVGLSSQYNPFNPLKTVTQIRYYLEETCRYVSVEIRGRGFDFLRTIGLAGAGEGENYFIWDGRDNQGELVDAYRSGPDDQIITPDGDYEVTVIAVDQAGNESIPLTGNVKISLAQIYLKNLTMMPTRYFKYGHTVIEFDVELHLTMEGRDREGNLITYGGEDLHQLQNLDFWGSTDIWALCEAVCYNKDGSKSNLWFGQQNPDLTPDSDTDEFWASFFNVYRGSTLQRRGEIFEASLLGKGNFLDRGNDNKSDDFDVLVRLYDNGGRPPHPGDDGVWWTDDDIPCPPYYKTHDQVAGDHIYTGHFAVVIYDTGSEPGLFHLQVHVKLSGRRAKFVGDTSKNPEIQPPEEYWHFKPNFVKGKGIFSEALQVPFEIAEPPFHPGDDKPPYITDWWPPNNAGLEPGVVGQIPSPPEKEYKFFPRVKFAEGFRGIGIDLVKSRIEIIGPLGLISGECKNDGQDTIYYKLAEPLTQAGEYRFYIYLRDRIGNAVKDPIGLRFTILDREVPYFSDPDPFHEIETEGLSPEEIEEKKREVAKRKLEEVETIKVKVTDGTGVGLSIPPKKKISRELAERFRLREYEDYHWIEEEDRDRYFEITLYQKDEKGERKVLAYVGQKERKKGEEEKTPVTFIYFVPDAEGSNRSGTIFFKYLTSSVFKEGVEKKDGKADPFFWEVKALDENRNQGEKTYRFYLYTEDCYEIKINGKVYARIPRAAKAEIDDPEVGRKEVEEPLSQMEGRIVPRPLVPSPPEEFDFLEPVVEFSWWREGEKRYNRIYFTPEIAIIMHYQDEEVQKTLVGEKDLRVFVFKDGYWQKKRVSQDTEKNTLSFFTREVGVCYAVMYQLPQEKKKHFNPADEEKYIFYFDEIFPEKKVKSAKITIYNLAGHFICSLEENRGIFFQKGKIYGCWNGENERGEVVHNGVYIAVIEAQTEGGERLFARRLAAVIK